MGVARRVCAGACIGAGAVAFVAVARMVFSPAGNPAVLLIAVGGFAAFVVGVRMVLEG